MIVVCAVLTVWRSLTTWNPWTELGWVTVDGHDYLEEESEPGTTLIRCERCGHREVLWQR